MNYIFLSRSLRQTKTLEASQNSRGTRPPMLLHHHLPSHIPLTSKSNGALPSFSKSKANQTPSPCRAESQKQTNDRRTFIHETQSPHATPPMPLKRTKSPLAIYKNRSGISKCQYSAKPLRKSSDRTKNMYSTFMSSTPKDAA